MEFALAPMSTALRVMTWMLFALPALFMFATLAAPPPVNAILLGTTVFVVLLYASVWFIWRPSGFVLDESTLRIVWPTRSRAIARADVEEAIIVSAAEFRREYGYGMRIGVGGLWGGFGLLKTGRATFSMWLSRTDEFVIVRLRGARPLLITPEDPARFVRALRAQ